MAEVKNFGLIGIGSSVQFGKGGARIRSNAGVMQFRNADDNAFAKVQGGDPTDNDDLVTLRHLTTIPGFSIEDGMDLPLGAPGDGTFEGGAVSLTDTDTVTNAIDSMNEILGLLVPPQPPAWPNGAAITLENDSQQRLASGEIPNHTGDTIPTAGSQVTTVFSTSYTTDPAGNSGDAGSGPGTTGTVTVLKNGGAAGSMVLTENSDVGQYGDLNIIENSDYPASTPGFWRMLRARATGTVNAGYNKVQITHSDANDTVILNWIADNITSASPGLTGAAVADTGGLMSYSSSVPHYRNNQPLNISGTLTNICGYVYRESNVVRVQTSTTVTGSGSIVGTSDFNWGDGTLPAAPRPVGDTNQAFTVSPVTADVHASGRLQVRHSNARSIGSFVAIASPTILVMGDTGRTNIVDEDNVLADTFGVNRAYRIDMTGDAQSDTPDATYTAGTANWDGTAVLEAFDAAVVGGRLSHDRTNYSTGYIPVGPDLTGQSTDRQYITFVLYGIKSKFGITVTGNYASCNVKLPGVSDDAAYYGGGGTNGWWNMFVAYGGAGVPGDGPSSNGSFGCAEGTVMSGGTGTFTCTFGSETSSNSTNNAILVRFGLNSGNAITALSFGSA